MSERGDAVEREGIDGAGGTQDVAGVDTPDALETEGGVEGIALTDSEDDSYGRDATDSWSISPDIEDAGDTNASDVVPGNY
jgi:hypothetical protein